MTTWQWLRATPRWLVLLAAVAATWGMWLAHVHGREIERGLWERFRTQTQLHCVRPPEAFRGSI